MRFCPAFTIDSDTLAVFDRAGVVIACLTPALAGKIGKYPQSITTAEAISVTWMLSMSCY